MRAWGPLEFHNLYFEIKKQKQKQKQIHTRPIKGQTGHESSKNMIKVLGFEVFTGPGTN